VQQAQSRGNDQGPIAGSAPADLTLTVDNSGQGTILLCPGVTLVRETQSPSAATRGLLDVRFTGSAMKLFRPGETLSFSIKGAFQPGDIPPGTYTWKVLVNPTGGSQRRP